MAQTVKNSPIRLWDLHISTVKNLRPISLS